MAASLLDNPVSGQRQPQRRRQCPPPENPRRTGQFHHQDARFARSRRPNGRTVVF